MTQQTMYPAMVNSPQTELSAGIDAAQTTVPVTDASKLPPAPNLATIGSDETAETILYTGKTGNTLTGVTRGYQGTAKAWTTGVKVARLFTAADWDAARNNLQDLAAADPTPVTLSPGLQNIIANRRSRLRIKDIKGRTLVNLLGRDGGCESLTPFAITGTAALSTTQVRSGLNSIKFTASSSAAIATKDYTYPLDTTKQYLIGAWVYIESYTSGTISLSLRDVGTSTARYNVSPDTSKVGSWQFIYLKVPTANTLVGTGFRLLFGPNGSGTMVVYFDELRLYEISSADSTAIDSMTAAQVAAKWPYVDDAKHTNAVYVQNAGKNLIDSFSSSDWTIASGATIKGANSLTLVNTAPGGHSSYPINLLPNTTYTIRVEVLGDSNVRWNLTPTKASSSFSVIQNQSSTATITFTTDAATTLLYLNLYSNTAGTYTFNNPILVVGDASAMPATFEPKRGSYMYLPNPQLASNVDGTVADSLYTDGEGKPRVTRRWREMVLDGALVWSYNTSGTGFKGVQVSVSGGVANSQVVVKYSGTLLKNWSTGFTSSDLAYWTNAANPLVLSIAAADSGWGDAYTPSAAEIAAYFYGYKMYNSDTGTPAGAQSSTTYNYNGTGTKAWVNLVGSPAAFGAATVALGPASGYTPYRLIYQLASSADEPVNYEGDLVMHEGGNQIEVGTGIVVREAAKPTLGTNWDINNKTTGSALKYRVAKFVGIYRSDRFDALWSTWSGVDVYGNVAASILPSRFDAAAPYAVTYLALDTYSLGIAPQSISADYAPNIKEDLDDVTRAVTDLKREVSVLQTQKAGKQQPQWIAPTLVNGWVNYGSGETVAGYYKDDRGYVFMRGLIKSGAIGQAAFTLPAGYRPDSPVRVSVNSNLAFGSLIISTDGRVIIDSGSSTSWTSLAAVPFLATQ
ncbi:hypothetical protein [Cohnella sp. GbtcB17]|uniref:hypothetical protein n=1 Tax=Cohnella sp. GbtcB17 TaxID=2824762 RepID=UPI001C308A37|nr:hypothetical protein [Cohnella sp. GbtcB17]